MYPEKLRYSREHEWVKELGSGMALVGITFFAQEQLGDIVYLDLPPVKTHVNQFEKMGEVESVKAVSELYAPASGEVMEVNEQIIQKPELVNQDPYNSGWLIKVKLSDLKELANLMDATQYQAMLPKK